MIRNRRDVVPGRFFLGADSMRSVISKAVFGMAVGSVMAAAPMKSFGLADFNTPGVLPAGLENAVVRVSATGGGPGTGTIISITPDNSGGNVYCVLTADHVLRDAANPGGLPASVSIGFGSVAGTAAGNFPYSTTNTATQVKLDAPVDLAVFSIDIPKAQLGNLPVITAATVTAPVIPATGTSPIIQAGYGDQATVGVGAPFAAGQAYYESQAQYGTYASGMNTISLASPFGRYANGIYAFSALQGIPTFTLDASGNPLSATSYVLSGDSGGPTFQTFSNGKIGLIGVHSASTPGAALPGGQEAVSGSGAYQWTDVNASVYNAWINTNCTAVDAAAVPEPAALALMAIGGAALLLVQRKRQRLNRGDC